MFCNQRLFRWWCVETVSSTPETSTRCCAASKSTTRWQSVSSRMTRSLLSLTAPAPFLRADDLFSLAQMKNRPVLRTPSYCVQPLSWMKSASRWPFLHLALREGLQVLLGSRSFLKHRSTFMVTDHEKLAIPSLCFFMTLIRGHIPHV